jgi:hypothetical protein
MKKPPTAVSTEFFSIRVTWGRLPANLFLIRDDALTPLTQLQCSGHSITLAVKICHDQPNSNFWLANLAGHKVAQYPKMLIPLTRRI